MRLKSKAMVAQSLGQRDLLEGECWVGAVRCVLGLTMVVSFTWGVCGGGASALVHRSFYFINCCKLMIQGQEKNVARTQTPC